MKSKSDIEFVREYKIVPASSEKSYDVLYASGRLYFYTEENLPKTVKEWMKGKEATEQHNHVLKRDETIYKERRNEMNTNYRYGMRNRGYSIGCQPMNGLKDVAPDDNERYRNILTYDRELTAQEVEDYELDFLGSKTEAEEIIDRLPELCREEFGFIAEMASEADINRKVVRAHLRGYLTCLVDLGKISVSEKVIVKKHFLNIINGDNVL